MAANAISSPPLTTSVSSSSSKNLFFARKTVSLSSSTCFGAVGASRFGSITIKRRSGERFGVVKCMASASPSVLPKALLFDCDGVLVDTEKDGHRVSFNDTFDEVLSTCVCVCVWLWRFVGVISCYGSLSGWGELGCFRLDWVRTCPWMTLVMTKMKWASKFMGKKMIKCCISLHFQKDKMIVVCVCVWFHCLFVKLSWWVELGCFRLDCLRIVFFFFLFSFVWSCNIYEWFWLWLKWNGLLNSRGKSDIMLYFFTFFTKIKW